MKHEKQVAELNGAFSAIFTPFDKSNEVNFDMLTKIGNYQLERGISGFFVAGSTGEGLLLTEEERLSVIQHLVTTFSGRATIIAHVGHPSTDQATELARKSAIAGVDWIASMGPIFHGSTFSGAMRHYEQISNATDLPFMVYSIGASVDPIRDAAFFELPNVCGLKYTGANFFSVQQLANHLSQPVAFMSGFDEQFVAALSFGFSGGIGSTFNFGPQYYSGIFRHYQSGEISQAAQLQADINRVTHLMVQYENWSYRKAIMKYIGFDCGHCRSPYKPLTQNEYDTFTHQLNELDILIPAENQTPAPEVTCNSKTEF